MEEITGNIEKENNSDIDINQSMRDADGDIGIEMHVAVEVDIIIDRRVEQDDLDENTKMILTNIVEKMEAPINLEAVNLRNVDREKVKEKTPTVNQMLSRIHTESVTEANFNFGGSECCCRIIRQKEN